MSVDDDLKFLASLDLDVSAFDLGISRIQKTMLRLDKIGASSLSKLSIGMDKAAVATNRVALAQERIARSQERMAIHNRQRSFENKLRQTARDAERAADRVRRLARDAARAADRVKRLAEAARKNHWAIRNMRREARLAHPIIFELGRAALSVVPRFLRMGRTLARTFIRGLRTIGTVRAAIRGLVNIAREFGRTFAPIPQEVKDIASNFTATNFIKVASDMEEASNKLRVVFKKTVLISDAETFISRFGNAAGRSKLQLTRFISEFQDLFVPMGMTREAAAGLGKEMTKLVVDLASFNNVADDKVFKAIVSGLVGQSRAVRQYGIDIGEVAVLEEFRRKGLDVDMRTATLLQKIQARATLSMKHSSDAMGDAIRTAHQFENQMKGLGGAVEDLSVIYGKRLIESVRQVLLEFGGFDGLKDRMRPLFEIVTSVGEALGVLSKEALGSAIEWVDGLRNADTGLRGVDVLVDQIRKTVADARDKVNAWMTDAIKGMKDWVGEGEKFTIKMRFLGQWINTTFIPIWEGVGIFVSGVFRDIFGLIDKTEEKLTQLKRNPLFFGKEEFQDVARRYSGDTPLPFDDLENPPDLSAMINAFGLGAQSLEDLLRPLQDVSGSLVALEDTSRKVSVAFGPVRESVADVAAVIIDLDDVTGLLGIDLGFLGEVIDEQIGLWNDLQSNIGKTEEGMESVAAVVDYSSSRWIGFSEALAESDRMLDEIAKSQLEAADATQIQSNALANIRAEIFQTNNAYDQLIHTMGRYAAAITLQSMGYSADAILNPGQYVKARNFSGGYNLPGFAGGGQFRGRPGIDMNAIRITDKEFVMPALQTQRNLPELEAMRRGGGSSRSNSVTNNKNVNVTLQTTLMAVSKDMTNAELGGRMRSIFDGWSRHGVRLAGA